MKNTIYECCKVLNQYVGHPLKVVHYADTELEAIQWLEKNGGGVYRNVLHNFTMRVEQI